MDAATLKLAKNYTNEQVVQKATNSPVEEISFDGGIYSVGNNVVNGQVSVSLKGRTYRNELDVSNVATTITNNDGSRIKVKKDGSFGLANVYNSTLYKTINIIQDNKYYIAFQLKPNSVGRLTNVGLQYSGDSVDNVLVANTLRAHAVITATKSGLANPYSQCSATTQGEKYLDYALVVNLTALGDTETDLNKLAQKYTYVDGTKSTNSVRVKSVGKNLFDGELELGSISSSDGANSNTSSEYIRCKYYVRISNAEYRLSHNLSAVSNIVVYYYDINKDYISSLNIYSGGSPFTPPDGASYMRFRIYKIEATLNPVTTQVQVEENSSATEYEPYKESIVNVNLPEPLRSVPSAKDEVNVSTGVKTQRNKEIVLQSSNVLSLDTQYANLDRIRISKPTDSVDMGKVGSTRWSRLGDYPYKSVSVTDDIANVGFYCDSPPGIPNEMALYVQKGQFANLTEVKNALTGTTLTYQLATPIVTKLPAQAPLQVFENGTVYVEPMGDPAESTVPSVEMTIPTGTSNKFGVATHNYGGAAADWELTNSESKCFLLAVSNAGGSANIIAPDAPGVMYAINNASEYTITIKISGGNGVDVNTGKKVLVIHNGTDYVALTAEL